MLDKHLSQGNRNSQEVEMNNRSSTHADDTEGEEVIAVENETSTTVQGECHEDLSNLENGSGDSSNVDEYALDPEKGIEPVAPECIRKDQCGSCCTVTKMQFLCLNLKPQPLPVLTSAFWGTEWILEKIKLSKSFRVKWGVSLLFLFTFAALGGFLGLAYFDISYTPSGYDSNPTYFSCLSKYWFNRSRTDDYCGIDASNCRPLKTNYWMLGRCPKDCLISWSEPVLGSGPYAASGRICASAIHAGVIPAGKGGCFEFRFAGDKTNYEGSTSNGVTSESYGWFPRSIEFRKVDDWNCNQVRPWIDVYVTLFMIIVFIIIRPDSWYTFLFLGVTGFLYLATEDITNDNLIQVLNTFSPRLLTILVFSYFLWANAGKKTMPRPETLPIDGLLFYFLPFWMGVHMDAIQNLGLNLSFSSSIFSSGGYIVGFILFLIIGIPLVVLQATLLYKAGLLGKLLFYALWCIFFVVIVSVAAKNLLSIHLHHYMIGGFGFLIFQGQPKLRYTIIVQGLMLGVFVNGVTVWNIASLYDNKSSSSSSSRSLFWSGINITGTNASFEWAESSVVLDVWNCSQNGLEKYIELMSNDTNSDLPEALQSSSRSRILLSSITSAIPEEVQGILEKQPSSSQRTFWPNLPFIDPLVPRDGAPFFQLFGNSILLSQGYLATSEAYTVVHDLRYPNSTFQMSVGDLATSSQYLYLKVLPDTINTTILGGGFYDGGNSFYSNPCNRVYALLSTSQNLTRSVELP